ncbi:TldD/PmbA family protein [Vallitalea pronyensis]|uniref:TldD/PmbA family protein n=1 Tax=Vallitalea pronyensis TaxID=1348613 RepID=A0A8J8MLZ6_9FIRM|nr:TldD/PmbA family protein [Vallitalea pronyensis]QUI23946.1 TldD/PmbA family protein [Vallitalea pronyensis]
MQVKLSDNLNRHMQLMKRLVDMLDKDFDYVSILGTDVSSRVYSVRTTGESVQDFQYFLECGYVVRVYNGRNYSEHSFNEFSEALLKGIYEDILAVGQAKFQRLKKEGMPINGYAKLEEAFVQKAFHSELEIEPATVTAQEKLEKLTAIMHKGLKMSNELVDVRVSYHETQVSKVFISKNKELSQSYTYTNGLIVPLAKRGNNVQYSFDTISGLKGVELLDELEEKCQGVVDEAIALLDAERVEPGEYDIICNPKVTGVIAHEAFGHGVETDMFVKDRAKAPEYMNKQVAAPMVTMKDGVKSYPCPSSYFFDDEGTIGNDTVIIQDGMLKSGISDILSANVLETKPTGNGRRESFERKAYARMTNTYFESGKDELSDMIASIKHGYLLENIRSGMEDPKNWGIQVVVHLGREIKDGKLTGKIISPVFLTGYVPELLQSITMMSKDFELSGSGACGKGHKEVIKTTDGGPYIKAKGRLA